MRKQKVLLGACDFEVIKFLLQYLERTQGTEILVLSICEEECVAKERISGSCFLTQIVHAFGWDNHLRFERHRGGEVPTMTLKKTANIGRFPGFLLVSADGPGGVQERPVGKGAEKADGVEEIGFSDAVGPCDTGEWSEADIHINEVLEPRDFQAS